MNEARSKRPIVFGEVLFDCFPDGSMVLGGAPFNVAWHLQAFGRQPLFISKVGDDPLGQRVRDTMLDWGMDTSGLQLDSTHPTGTVQVVIEDGEPHYDIVADRAYDFVSPDALPPIGDAALIYHGSLALRGEVTRSSFHQLLDNTRLPRFVDVNLRPPWWRLDAVRQLIEAATWVKLNQDELKQLSEIDGLETEGEAFRRQFGLQALLLTQGSKGAQWLADDGALSVSPQPAKQVVDTVGAGDAFAGIILLGLLMGWDDRLTLERAQSFASAMVGKRGATVQDRAFYRHFAAAWALPESA